MAHRRKADEKRRKPEKIQKRRQNREAEKKIQHIITVVFVILLIFIIIKGTISFIDLKAQQREAEKTYGDLQDKKAELQETLQYINTPEYIENAAREMLKMVMPGEILYILKDSDESNENSD